MSTMHAAVFVAENEGTVAESVGAVVIARTKLGVLRRVKAVLRQDYRADWANPDWAVDPDPKANDAYWRGLLKRLGDAETLEEVNDLMHDHDESGVVETSCISTFKQIAATRD